MFGRAQEKASDPAPATATLDANDDPLAAIPKSTWDRLWPVLACGSGLFSDGYINNVSRAPAP